MNADLKKKIIKATIAMFLIGIIIDPIKTVLLLIAILMIRFLGPLVVALIVMFFITIFSPFLMFYEKIENEEKEEIEQKEKQRNEEDALLIERSKLSK